MMEPKINRVGFKRNNSSKVIGKPPEHPEIATMPNKMPKRDAHEIKKPH